VVCDCIDESTQSVNCHPFVLGEASDPPRQVTLRLNASKVDLVWHIEVDCADATFRLNHDLAPVVAFNQFFD